MYADLVSLLAFPLALELVGVVDLYYLAGAHWPKPVRANLKEAARAERKGDFNAAEKYYALAADEARKAAASTGWFSRLGSTPEEVLYKLSSIAVGRGAALEAGGKYPEAFKTYLAAFEELTRAGPLSQEQVTIPDNMRAVAIAKKLGDLASSGKFVLPSAETNADGTPVLEDMDKLADEYYRWAVQHMLPMALPVDAQAARLTAPSGGQGIGAEGPEPPKGDPVKLAHPTSYPSRRAAGAASTSSYGPLQHLTLPDWAQSADLGNALEALASFYSVSGHPERAAQLYNHAISLLRSPLAHAETPAVSHLSTPLSQAQLEAVAPQSLLPGLPTDTKCHAGLLFYNLVNVLLAAADRPWKEQGKTKEEASQRQTDARARAMTAARDGLALVRQTEAEVGIPPSPDPVTTVGKGSVAPLSTATVPLPAAPVVSNETLDECKLAEAGLLFALGRTIASQGGDADAVAGLYSAAADASQPIAARAPLTEAHVTAAAPPQDPIPHGTRESASILLSEIALAQNKKL